MIIGLGVKAALVTAPVFKTGETSFRDVWWVRFPSTPVFFLHDGAAEATASCPHPAAMSMPRLWRSVEGIRYARRIA